MQNNVEGVSPVSSVSGKTSIGGVNVPTKHTVETVSYAMIVMEVLNNVGLEKQQAVMQVRGKLMDVMTRMQNDFTTISEYLSQIENNAHSGGSSFEDEHMDMFGTNTFNGLDNSFYHVNATVTNCPASSSEHHGTVGLIQGPVTEMVSDAFNSSTEGFVNAVKDLFFGSSGAGGGITVADISKISDPHGGPDFDFSAGPPGGYWGTLQAAYEKQFPGIGSNMIMSDPSASPSLLQQYMYYKTQVDVYTLPATQIKKANGQVDLLENFNPSSDAGANQPPQDALIGTFMEELSALNTSVTCGRDEGDGTYGSDWGTVGGRTAPSLLSLIAKNQMNIIVVPGQMHHSEWHSGASGPAGTDHGYDNYYDQFQPGLYMTVAMLGFNYFWTKNPNASCTSSITATTQDKTPDGDASTGFNDGAKGSVSSDPLSSIYMTNNSVQTNIGQISSQSNNNFQSDVNVAGQLDNMGVNSIKSFFEGSTTMNNNCRIS